MPTVVNRTDLPGGAVLLEPEKVEAPSELLEKIPHYECAVCWKGHKRHRRAVIAFKDDPIRFSAITPELEQPFMALCAPHARKTQKKLKQRLRQIERYSTNHYRRESD